MWHPHRTRNARNCDQCPPRHPASWILKLKGQVPYYLCHLHAERMAHVYEIEPPPILAGKPKGES